MNFNRDSIYGSSEKIRESYKARVQNLESINDILKQETKEDKQKFSINNDEIKNQNNYFKDFLTGNLSKIMKHRVNSSRFRKHSFLNLQELKNMKKRASFFGRFHELRNENNPKNKINYDQLGIRDFYETNDLNILNNKKLSRLSSESQMNAYDTTKQHKNKRIDTDFGLKTSAHTSGFYHLNRRISSPVKKSSFDPYLSKSSSVEGFKNKNLHPRLSMRINQFISDLNNRKGNSIYLKDIEFNISNGKSEGDEFENNMKFDNFGLKKNFNSLDFYDDINLYNKFSKSNPDHKNFSRKSENFKDQYKQYENSRNILFKKKHDGKTSNQEVEYKYFTSNVMKKQKKLAGLSNDERNNHSNTTNTRESEEKKLLLKRHFIKDNYIMKGLIDKNNKLDYNSYNIDRNIELEIFSPKKNNHDSETDKIFQVETKKLRIENQNFQNVKYRNLLNEKDSIYTNTLDDEEDSEYFSRKKFRFCQNENLKSNNEIRFNINELDIDNENNKISNSCIKNDRLIILKPLKSLSCNKIPFKYLSKISPFKKQSNLNKINSSSSLENNNKMLISSNSLKLRGNSIKPKNFFEKFDNEIEKQKSQMYQFSNKNVFSNFDKNIIMDKINRKQIRLTEKERKIETSKKTSNFQNSPEKKLIDTDANKIEKFELVKKNRSSIVKDLIVLPEKSNLNASNSIEKLELTLDKFRFLSKRDNVEDSLSDEEDFVILNNQYEAGCLIENDSLIRKYWDFIIGLITLYTLLIAPFRLAFNDIDCIQLDFFEMSMDCIFILDIIFQFFIPYYNAEEDLIKNKYFIAQNYLGSWFFLDVLASIPGSIISYFLFGDDQYNNNLLNISVSNSSGGSISKINKVTRITKLYKIIKFTKLSKIIKLSNDKNKNGSNKNIPSIEDLNINSSIKRLVNFFLVFILVTHIITCVWIFIGNSTYPNWIFKNNLMDRNTGDLYISSLYFHWTTIFTIGYGDIISQNTMERLYNCILMFVGVLIYSFAVSSLGTIVSSYDGLTLKFTKNIEQLEDISRRYNVPEKFNEKVYKYLRYDYKFNKTEKFAFINELPLRLKNNLLINMYRDVIKNFKFLKENSQDFTSKVVFMMKPLRMYLKEYIITEGEFLEEVIFIRRGNLSIHLGKNYNEHKVMEIRKNEHFGDILVLSNLRSPVTIKVGSKLCDLLIIKKQDLLEIAADFPESIEEIFLVSSFNYSSLMELIENKKNKLDIENQKIINRKVEFFNYLNTKNAGLVENLNLMTENKRVVENITQRMKIEKKEEKNNPFYSILGGDLMKKKSIRNTVSYNTQSLHLFKNKHFRNTIGFGENKKSVINKITDIVRKIPHFSSSQKNIREHSEDLIENDNIRYKKILNNDNISENIENINKKEKKHNPAEKKKINQENYQEKYNYHQRIYDKINDENGNLLINSSNMKSTNMMDDEKIYIRNTTIGISNEDMANINNLRLDNSNDVEKKFSTCLKKNPYLKRVNTFNVDSLEFLTGIPDENLDEKYSNLSKMEEKSSNKFIYKNYLLDNDVIKEEKEEFITSTSNQNLATKNIQKTENNTKLNNDIQLNNINLNSIFNQEKSNENYIYNDLKFEEVKIPSDYIHNFNEKRENEIENQFKNKQDLEEDLKQINKSGQISNCIHKENEMKRRNSCSSLYSSVSDVNLCSLKDNTIELLKDKIFDNNKDRTNLLINTSKNSKEANTNFIGKGNLINVMSHQNDSTHDYKNFIEHNKTGSNKSKKFTYQLNYDKKPLEKKRFIYKKGLTFTNSKLQSFGKRSMFNNESYSESDNDSSHEEQKNYFITKKKNKIKILIKCENCNHFITIDKTLIEKIQKGEFESIHNSDNRDETSQNNFNQNTIIPKNIENSFFEKSSISSNKNNKNIKNIYNIYNNCNFNQTIETTSKLLTCKAENNFSNTVNSKKYFVKSDNEENCSISNSIIEKNTNIKFVKSDKKQKSNFDSKIDKKDSRFSRSFSEELKKISDKHNNLLIARKINYPKSKIAMKETDSSIIKISDNLKNNFQNIVNLGNYNDHKFNNQRFSSENNINKKSNLFQRYSKTHLDRLSNHDLKSKIFIDLNERRKLNYQQKFQYKNKVKENLKNVRNRLRNKDSMKFRKSTEIVNNIYNSLFLRNKVLNNPDEFYFNEFKVLFTTGLEEEIKKESQKINTIIKKILKLERFSNCFIYDEKKNCVELKTINNPKKEHLDFIVDIPFMDVEN